MTGLARRLRAPDGRAILFLILLPVIANIGIVSGAISCDPETIYGNLAAGAAGGGLPGAACFVDPAVGYITQPLGYLSAQSWLHGIVPWWNPYNGVGMPLAAEMQDESLFLPFVLLLHLHNGWLLQRLLLQMFSGIATWRFLRVLGIRREGAVVGASLFALNAAFILIPGTASVPDFCLPLLLLGVERARRAATLARPMGWSLAVLALAASIYAGFPETAFLNGLLAVAWSVLRLAQLPRAARLRLLGKLVAASGIGLALAAPAVLPFLQYVAAGDVDGHAGPLAHDALPASAAPLQMFPWFYGALAQGAPAGLADAFHNMWVRFGGWFGCAPVLLALYASVKRRLPAERWLLAGWVAAWQARDFGVPGMTALFNLVPGVAATDLVRYSNVSVEFAVFALAAFGLDDLLHAPRPSRRRLAAVLAAFAACAAVSVAPALKYLPAWYGAFAGLLRFTLLYAALTAAGTLLLIHAMLTRRGLRFAACVPVAAAVLMFLLPQASSTGRGQIDAAPIAFLKAHLGLSRFYTLGPFSPNFAASYGLASINENQLPVPRLWSDAIHRDLFTFGDAFSFGGNQPGQAEALRDRLDAYRALGVAYVVAAAGQDPFAASVTVGRLGAGMRAFVLNPGATITGTVGAGPWPIHRIDAVSVRVATFPGGADGTLGLQLCAAGACGGGQVAVDGTANRAPVTVALRPPVAVADGGSLTYRITRPAGPALVVWLGGDGGQAQRLRAGAAALPGLAPILVLSRSAPGPVRVFHDGVADIYALPDPVPYAQTMGGNCRLAVLSRQAMRADCDGPAELLRREQYDPGWTATVDRRPVPVRLAPPLFQAVALPAGASVVRFRYAPPHIRLAVAAALLAFAAWAGAAWRAGRRQPG